jgi:hypothetical protein
MSLIALAAASIMASFENLALAGGSVSAVNREPMRVLRAIYMWIDMIAFPIFAISLTLYLPLLDRHKA